MHSYHYIVSVLAGTLLLSSCVKDPAQQRDSDRLQFSIEQASDWGTPKTVAQTKSENQSSTTTSPVILRGETSKDTLFLHSSIKENTGFRETLTDSNEKVNLVLFT